MRRRLGGAADWDLHDTYSERSLRRYISRVQRTTTSPNGVWATKIMWYQHEHLHRWGLDLNNLGPRTTWVRLRRIDQIAQACSHHRASVTGAWTARDGDAPPAPPYDAEGIAKALAHVRADAAGWDQWFAANGIEPLTLTYEAIAADPVAAAGAVLHLLGEATPPTLSSPLRRQRDATTDEWIARFHADRPDLIHP